MGTQSSKNLCKDSNNINNSSSKSNRGSKPRFVSPENRVLPVVTNGPTRLRSTDNGNILQSGGTISGRRNIQSESENISEFSRFMQKKSQASPSSQNVSFQTLFGHKKSHSDPDIVRKMMEENETEEDDDCRCETESNPNQRSVIALSPSKAKIQSRKKKKAPEPPLANTLPRTITCRNLSKYETQEICKFNSAYESTEAPRRPLPPIPLDEMPPPPPPPPPDYNRTINNREIFKSSGKNFQKNRRVVDKWKFCKPNFENFAERRQRSKSLDRMDEVKPCKKVPNPNSGKFDRNYSFRNSSHRENPDLPQRGDVNQNPRNSALHEAIIDAAKKRAERIARNRNLSFRSSMNQSYEVETADSIDNSIDCSGNERSIFKKGHVQSNSNDCRNHHNYKEHNLGIIDNEEMCSSRNLEPHSDRLKRTQYTDHLELNARTQQNPQKCFIEQNFSRCSENLDLDSFTESQKPFFERENSNRSTGHIKNQYSYTQSYSSYPSVAKPNNCEDAPLRERENTFTNRDAFYEYSRTKASTIQHEYEHKDSFEYNKDRYRNENKVSNSSHLTEQIDEHLQPTFTSSVERDVTKLSNYSHYKHESESPIGENSNNISRSFSRVSAIRKRSQDNKKKNSDYRSKSSENVTGKSHDNNKHLDLGILPYEIPAKWNSRPGETIIPFLSNCKVSTSSISEEEMEINLQLRPTLPRRPMNISRFSPTDVWKSINLDFFKSHQQRSDVSSENGDDIMEEKIHHINKPVAPRRMIHDRSGDSGISPDAGSPMFINENPDSPVVTNTVLCSPTGISNEDPNNTWIPQHDLDDSDCGTDTSRDSKFNTSNEIVQPKLAMPNFMFPSRSLTRSDSKNEIQEKVIADKEKTRSRDKRKKGAKNNETQHFNSLRNLKRALGIKQKVFEVDVDGLDSNWSLSRSLPNFENENNIDDAKIENKVPDASALDVVRRSNSESRTRQQENKNYAVNSSNYKNSEWRKSFPGQSSEGHVMYLPQYCSTPISCQTIPSNIKDQNYVEDVKTNHESEHSEEKFVTDSTDKKSKSKKKFSYQSTIRQLEKRRLQEQLAKEVQEKEKKREKEKAWMNEVEDVFRKERGREKSDVRLQLRIFNLETNRRARASRGSNAPYYIRESVRRRDINKDKENCVGFEGDVLCSPAINVPLNKSHLHESAQIASSYEHPRNSRDICHTPDPIQLSTDTSGKKKENYPQRVDSTRQPNSVQRSFYREISAISKTAQQSSNQRREERTNVVMDTSHPTNVSRLVSKSIYSKKTIHDGRLDSNIREVSVDRNLVNDSEMNGDNHNVNSTYSVDCNRVVNDCSYMGENNLQRHKKMKENTCVLDNFQASNQNNMSNYACSANISNSCGLNDKRRESSHERFLDAKDDERYESTECTYSDRTRDNYVSHLEDKVERRNMPKNHDGSYIAQQPTGMKKWLRRQNREHQRQENIPRPEPEGARSSSDDCKQIDGKREIMNGRSPPIGANFSNPIICSHGRGFHCGICNQYETPGFSRNGTDFNISSVPSDRKGRSERARDDRHEVHLKSQISKLNGNGEHQSDIPEFVRDSMGEYELHTKLCRTNSGRTFESHSYYALERRRDDATEFEPSRKSNISKKPNAELFSSTNFEQELKENVRKKSHDMEKRSRKYQSRDFDSDESVSDIKEAHYQRYNTRNLKKKSVSEHREPSFSRNHPHRNGARLKTQTNGHFINGRLPSASKNSPHAVQ